MIAIRKSKKKLSVILLADERLLPAGDLADFSSKQQMLRKTEFDVKQAIEFSIISLLLSASQMICRQSAARSTPISPTSSSIWSKSSAASHILISTSSVFWSCCISGTRAAIRVASPSRATRP